MNTLSSHSEVNKRIATKYMSRIVNLDGMTAIELMSHLIDENLITGTNVVENAMVKESNGSLKLCPCGKGRDFTDDTDAKTATVRHRHGTHMNNKTGKEIYRDEYIAPIGGANKIGGLRVVIFNPFNEREHFLYVPREIVKNSKTIEIRFDNNTYDISGKYIPFEFETFEDICKPVKELLKILEDNI